MRLTPSCRPSTSFRRASADRMIATVDTERAIESPASQDDEELVMFLERDQLVVDKSRPVPRAALGGRARAALWALRAFASVVSAMVLYTFVSQVVH
jgi:hypothetical protein